MGEGKRNTAPASHEYTVDFRRLMCLRWLLKWSVATITLGVAITAIIFALLIPDTYRAEAFVAPDDSDRAEGLSLLAVPYGGLAGIDLGDWLVKHLNSSIMQRDAAEAEQATEYLNEQISNTSLAGSQSVLFSLIEEKTKTVMLARMTNKYLLKTLDPAVVPEEVPAPTGLDRDSLCNFRLLLFGDGRVGLLQLWTSVTQILYQSAIALAAVGSYGN